MDKNSVSQSGDLPKLIEEYAKAKSDLDLQREEGWYETIIRADLRFTRARDNLNNWLRAAGFKEVGNG